MKKLTMGALVAAALFAFGCSSNNRSAYDNGTGGSADQGQIRDDQKDIAQTERDNQQKLADKQHDMNQDLAKDQKNIDEQRRENQQDLASKENDLRKDETNTAANDNLNDHEKLTAQAGVVTGKVTDLSDKSFTVKVPEGKSVEIQKSTTAGTAMRDLAKGEEVRATYRVDKDGNKIAQDVTVIHATTTPDTTNDLNR